MIRGLTALFRLAPRPAPVLSRQTSTCTASSPRLFLPVLWRARQKGIIGKLHSTVP